MKQSRRSITTIPFSFVTSISSAVEPNRLRPSFGDSEPPELLPPGDEPFSKPFLTSVSVLLCSCKVAEQI